MHDASAVDGAERVDEVAHDEGEERHREPVGDGRGGAHGHHRRVPPVREREQPVHRHRLRLRLRRASPSPSPSSTAARHRSP